MESMQEHADKLVEEMLGFLECKSVTMKTLNDLKFTASEEEEPTDECQIINAYCAQKTNSKEMEQYTNDDKHKNEKKQKTTIAMELKKIQSQFPLWHNKENEPATTITTATTACADKKLPIDPIWEENYALNTSSKQTIDDQETDWNSKLESNCRRSGNSYVQEVNRAIYGDTNGHPPYGSAEYYQMAQNYAIYGKDFLDFPENLTPLLGEKSSGAETAFPACGNGLYPTPTTTPTEPANSQMYGNFSKPTTSTTTAAATTSSYYQLCNGLQPTVRPATCSTAYGMFLGNKVTYVAAAPTAPPLVYNQHSSTATNFISNSLANAALATSPAIIYSNPMLTTTTQQYLNTFLKETQYLSCGAQGSAVGAATTGIYERLVYAQMLQQQIYHQTQQQAAAVAAMFQQHKTQRPQTRTANATGVVNSAMANTLTGLNLCGRQAAMASSHSHAANVATPVAIPANGGGGNDDNTAPAHGD